MTGVSASGGSFAPCFSADGARLLFLSSANDLVANDDRRPWLDVFAYDLVSGEVSLVSVNRSGEGGLDADATYVSSSADGRNVAFATRANNLEFNGTNRLGNIFLRDLAVGNTLPISVLPNGEFDNGTWADFSMVSADGRYVMFESPVVNLLEGPPAVPSSYTRQIYVRDVASNLTVRASQSTNQAGVPNFTAFSGDMTPCGRWIAFVAYDGRYSVHAYNRREVFLRDLRANTTFCVTRAVTNEWPVFTNATMHCYTAKISADGRFVVFIAKTSGTSIGTIWRFDTLTGLLLPIASDVEVNTLSPPKAWPLVSTNGNVVVFADRSLAEPSHRFCWDATTGSITGVDLNVAGSGPGNGSARNAHMTPDGSKIVFVSDATDLVPDFPASAAGTFQVYLRDRLSGVTLLLSTNGLGQLKGDYGATHPVISPDGTLVAFASDDESLAPGDLNRSSDVFLKNLVTGELILVSKRHNSLTGSANCPTVFGFQTSMSADGRYLAYTASDSLLVAADTNGFGDVFLHDLLTGVNRLASVGGPCGIQGNHAAFAPLLSPDGERLYFSSLSSNLFSGVHHSVEEGVFHLYSRNLGSGTTERLLSHDDASQVSPVVVLSPDGKYIAFTSQATNVVDYIPVSAQPGAVNLYVHDIRSRTNIIVTVNPRTQAGAGSALDNWQFSPDGRWLVFEGLTFLYDTNNVTDARNYLYLFNLETWVNRVIQVSYGRNSGFHASFSRNSAFLCFQIDGTLPYYDSIWRHDVNSGVTARVVDHGGWPCISPEGDRIAYLDRSSPSPGNIGLASISNGQSQLVITNPICADSYDIRNARLDFTYDGRYLVFQSKSANEATNDLNAASDVFVYDLSASNSVLISQNWLGNSTGNGASYLSGLGADGRTIVFHSFANDLVPNDFHQGGDLFVLRLGSGDLDSDGLDDNWEMANFGTLARDGTADFDGDGASDAAEYRAGTNPTRDKSRLEVFTIASLDGVSRRILWSGIPGKRYRLHYKDELDAAPWQELAGDISLAGATASMLDTNAAPAGRRFYRVVLE